MSEFISPRTTILFKAPEKIFMLDKLQARKRPLTIECVNIRDGSFWLKLKFD